MPTSSKLDEAEEGEAYQSGYVLATFKEKAFAGETSFETAAAPLTDSAKSAVSKMVSIDEENLDSVGRLDDNTAILKVRDGVSVSKAVQEIESSNNFEAVQANYIYRLAATTDDPELSKQWHISQDTETVEQAWDLQQTNGDVTVAVLDTGIDTDHEDLVDNIRESTAWIYDNWRRTWNNSGAEDIETHGTHVSGIVSAVSNNGIGVSGVSYNAKILSIRIMQMVYSWEDRKMVASGYTTDICKGISYAVSKKDEYNLRVISMSLGASRSSEDSYYKSAIDEAYAAGITVTCASGNESKEGTLAEVTSPGYLDNCIAVGAVGSDGARSYYSNCGSELDVVAPGGSGILENNDSIYSTKSDGTYGLEAGTSMATPYVAGIAALCYAANPSLTPANMYKILTATADRSQGKFTNEYGYGKVNPLNAVKAAKALSDGAAESCAVYFNGNGADNTPVGQVVKTGERVLIPSAVTRNNYYLEGWYTDENFTTKWDFSQPVTTDLTLWAKWTDTECTHSDTYYTIYTAPTCTEDGFGNIICKSCGWMVQADAVLPAAHKYAKQGDGWEATCTTDGKTDTEICSVCGETNPDSHATIQSLGHEYIYTRTLEPTCVAVGMMDITCERCDYSQKDVDIDIDPNAHDLVEVDATEATCISAGWHSHQKCNLCNVRISKVEGQEIDIPIDSTNHQHSEVRNAREGTCDNPGYTGDTYCTDCGEKLATGDEIVIPHTTAIKNEKASTCMEKGYTGDTYCTVCNQTLEAGSAIAIDFSNHAYFETVEAKDATCTEDGYGSYRRCKCGYETARAVIKATGHTFELGKCTACGADDPDYIEATSINLTVTGSGSVSFDKEAYMSGDTATMTIKSAGSGSNIIFPKSVSVDGIVVKTQSQLINKTSWSVVNSVYKNRMGENASSVEYTNVVNSLSQGTEVLVENLQPDTQITVEFEELVPVYRLYNMISSEHLFTTDKAEYDSWVAKSKTNSDYWIGEGINWFALANSDSQVTRLYNPALGAMGSTSHYYTSDAAEIQELTTKHGWQNEANQGKTFGSGGTIPIWTCYNEGLGSAHHYTSSKSEWQGLKAHGWDLETTKNGSTGVFSAVLSAIGQMAQKDAEGFKDMLCKHCSCCCSASCFSVFQIGDSCKSNSYATAVCKPIIRRASSSG